MTFSISSFVSSLVSIVIFIDSLQFDEFNVFSLHCLSSAVFGDFDRRILKTLRKIPPQATISYSELAERVKNPRAARAVGNALNRNPIPILIPCHRVVASQSLGGFMGTSDPDHLEVKMKSQLLQLEHQYRNPVFTFLTDTLPELVGVA